MLNVAFKFGWANILTHDLLNVLTLAVEVTVLLLICTIGTHLLKVLRRMIVTFRGEDVRLFKKIKLRELR